MSERSSSAPLVNTDDRPTSTERFSGRAETYDRFRQRYPTDEILALLRSWCGLDSNWLVADIGAGTGMLTEVFLANGNPVLAIEPNIEMRSIAARLLDRSPSLNVMDGTAEETHLSSGSVNLVAAGRAFHWFDVPRAMTEFRRILKPDGWMVLVSLGRAKDSSAQSVAFEELLLTHGIDYTYVRSGYRVHDNLASVFTADMHHAELPSASRLDWESFLGQTMSLSVAPRPDDPRFATFMQALRAYFEHYAVDHLLTMPATCWITAGRITTR
jgi:SAM-dependent methyltransferase